VIDKLATVVGRQFITLGVHLYVQHDGRNAARRAGLSAAAEFVVIENVFRSQNAQNRFPSHSAHSASL